MLNKIRYFFSLFKLPQYITRSDYHLGYSLLHDAIEADKSHMTFKLQNIEALQVFEIDKLKKEIKNLKISLGKFKEAHEKLRDQIGILQCHQAESCVEMTDHAGEILDLRHRYEGISAYNKKTVEKMRALYDAMNKVGDEYLGREDQFKMALDVHVKESVRKIQEQAVIIIQGLKDDAPRKRDSTMPQG